MKILIVTYHFYPEVTPRSFRATELAREFVRLGHEVTVYCAANMEGPRVPGGADMHVITYPACRDRLMKGAGIVARAVNRGLLQFFDYPGIGICSTVKKAVRGESGYDLLVTVAVPHEIHWAVGKLYASGRRLARRWVADCGDPWMLCASNSFRPPFWFKHLETRWCRLCDYISLPTETSYKGYYPEFHDKVKVIPQAFDLSEVQREVYEPHAVPTFAYSGSFIAGRREPRPFIDYLLAKGLDFRFVVYTQQPGLFAGYGSLLGDKIILKDYVPRLELLKQLSRMDFLLNLENGVVSQTPSKLIDYALTGRPVLSVDSSCLDTKKVDAFMAGDYSQRQVADISKFDIKVVAAQFLALA